MIPNPETLKKMTVAAAGAAMMIGFAGCATEEAPLTYELILEPIDASETPVIHSTWVEDAPVLCERCGRG